jgi:hypothetical protein
MACHWDKAIYTEASWNDENDEWNVKDKVANQKKIDKIKEDTASDPKTPPDCSMWK